MSQIFRSSYLRFRSRLTTTKKTKILGCNNNYNKPTGNTTMDTVVSLPEKKEEEPSIRSKNTSPTTKYDDDDGNSINDDPPELTLRALVGGVLVGSMLCFSNMYFGLQTGWVTMGSLQSALLGFGLFKALPGFAKAPFTAKENVVLQTTAVSASAMPLAGGFVGIIPALRLLSEDDDANDIGVEKTLFDFSIWQLYAWCFALGFFGVFMVPPLRRQTILREKLPFPSGTATAEIIRQLHGLPKEEEEEEQIVVVDRNRHNNGNGKEGDDDDDNQHRCDGTSRSKKEVASLSIDETAPLIEQQREGEDDDENNNNANPSTTKKNPTLPSSSSSSTTTTAPPPAPAWRLLFLSFAFSAVYTLLGNFVPIVKNIPLGSYIGLPALTAWSWTIQPSPSYFGQGLIMGPKTAVSMLLGTIIGWGVLAPMSKAKGWAPGPIQDVSTGARGWLLWVSLAIMLADSAMSLGLLSVQFLLRAIRRSEERGEEEELDPAPPHQQITWKIWLPGLFGASLLCTGVLAPMFDMPPFQPAVAVLFSLLVAVLAIRALGETDLNPVSGVGKVSQILFAVLAPGNVVANLVAGAIAEAGATSAGEMMQDLKCGHLLKASPRAQFYAQLVGTTFSCLLVVVAWNLYSSAYDIPGPEFPAPTALIWLDMAKVVNGGGLVGTTNVVPTAAVASVITVFLLVVDEVNNKKWMIPSAMAAAIGMYVTPNWTLPRVAGGLANHAWHCWDPRGADRYMIVVASGFVLGEGLMSIVNAGLKSSGSIGTAWVWCGGCPAGFCSGCS